MCKEREKLIKESVTSAFGNRADGVFTSPKKILVLNDPKPVGLDWIEIIDEYNIRTLVIRLSDFICMKGYGHDRFFVELHDGERMEVSLKEYERIANLLVHPQVRVPKEYEKNT